ncbi:MAG: hypothetical protein WCF25_06365 [Acidimicrobiales bacterium]
MNSDSLVEAKIGFVEEVAANLAVVGRRSLREDVERIVNVAEQLFSAIERHTQLIEEELVIACGEQARPIAQSAFQARLQTCATNFDSSLQEIAQTLTQRAGRGTSSVRVFEDAGYSNPQRRSFQTDDGGGK